MGGGGREQKHSHWKESDCRNRNNFDVFCYLTLSIFVHSLWPLRFLLEKKMLCVMLHESQTPQSFVPHIQRAHVSK